MTKGDLVELPDGRYGYYQGRAPDGGHIVLIEELRVVASVKRLREPPVEWKRRAKEAL